MTGFLVLRLAGPLMAFGDVAVDEKRPTAELPSQSMLTGLLANALGWRAREGVRLNRLQDRLVFGAMRVRTGEAFTDYQNAHIRSDQAMWRLRTPGPLTRKGGGSYDNVQRYRRYIADGAVTVVIALAPPDESPSLDEVRKALLRPARPLFLGRVSCPPSGPLWRGETVQAESVPEALALAGVFGEPPWGDHLSEWPGEGPLSGKEAPRRLLERADLRDWLNCVHAGRRLVAQGTIAPPAKEG